MAPDVEHDMNSRGALTISQHCGASPSIDIKLPLGMALKSPDAMANYTVLRECIGNGRGIIQIKLGQANQLGESVASSLVQLVV